MNATTLRALGFDLAQRTRAGLTVRCSQCAALVINGTPTHEHGCLNAKHECAGCNALVPVRVKYCGECQ
jgi:hypothetical protein